MRDLTIELPDRPGALAELGAALGEAGVSIEGGGAWSVDGRGVAHFLVADEDGARRALQGCGMKVVAAREVVTLRLDQERPGQLGAACARMAEAGVNIEAQYSSHDHRLILVVDDLATARRVAAEWPCPPATER